MAQLTSTSQLRAPPEVTTRCPNQVPGMILTTGAYLSPHTVHSRVLRQARTCCSTQIRVEVVCSCNNRFGNDKFYTVSAINTSNVSKTSCCETDIRPHRDHQILWICKPLQPNLA